MSEFETTLRTLLRGVCEPSEEQVRAMEAHYELLLKWNRRVNLTSIREPRKIVERHYCESVFLAQQLPADARSVVDVGSGAGFPGFCVAIMRPDARVTLVEASAKKAAFLKEASRKIPNIEVRNLRAEDLAVQFQWMISRAVAGRDLPLLAEHVAILGSDETHGSGWERRIRLPWGDRRYLLMR